MGTKISALAGGAALTGFETFPAVQSLADVGVTANQIKTFVLASLATVATSANAADLTAGTLNKARLPSLTSADFTLNVRNTAISDTPVIGDANGWVRFTGASAQVLTIPPNSSVAFPVGTEIGFSQSGAGGVTVAAGAGVTINSRGGLVALAGQYAVGSVKQVAANTWVLTGDLA